VPPQAVTKSAATEVISICFVFVEKTLQRFI